MSVFTVYRVYKFLMQGTLSAHRAAHPEEYPVKPEVRTLYPVLEGIEQRHGPTQVHLQVYDGASRFRFHARSSLTHET